MEEDSWLRAATTASEDVDAGDWATLHRGARRDDLGSGGPLGPQLVKPGDVSGIGVVVVEPGEVGPESIKGC